MTYPMQLPQKVASEVRAEMGRQQKTLAQMAEAIDLDVQAARRRYRGEKPLTLDEVEILAAWLGVDLDQLVLANREPVAS